MTKQVIDIEYYKRVRFPYRPNEMTTENLIGHKNKLMEVIEYIYEQRIELAKRRLMAARRFEIVEPEIQDFCLVEKKLSSRINAIVAELNNRSTK